MRFSLATVALLAAPMFAAPTAEPVELVKRARCQVQAQEIKLWVENGLTRRRIAISFVPGDADLAPNYNQFFDSYRSNAGLNGGSNIQTWVNGQGFIDCSWARGAGGDSIAKRIEFEELNWWVKRTGCCTGGGCS